MHRTKRINTHSAYDVIYTLSLFSLSQLVYFRAAHHRAAHIHIITDIRNKLHQSRCILVHTCVCVDLVYCVPAAKRICMPPDTHHLYMPMCFQTFWEIDAILRDVWKCVRARKVRRARNVCERLDRALSYVHHRVRIRT